MGQLAQLQYALLSNAVELVREGGTIVYCTCSLQPEEGPAVVARLLASCPKVRLVPIGAAEIAGGADWITPEGTLRTLPHHAPGPSGTAPGGIDGFFAARFVKHET